MGGRLEHEIRLLPQVLSCSFSQDDYVVVLIEPSADRWTIQLAVERILQNAGSEATVRVIGPSETAAVGATRAISPLVATATVASVAALGIGALVGGLAAAEHPKVKPTYRPAAPPLAAAPFDTLDALRGLQSTAQQPVTAQQVSVPVETPDHTLRVLPVSLGNAAEAVSLSRAMPRIRRVRAGEGAASAQHATNVRGAPRERNGRHLGNGPRPWSHSALLPPHEGKGR
jgi:hypothetical protein